MLIILPIACVFLKDMNSRVRCMPDGIVTVELSRNHLFRGRTRLWTGNIVALKRLRHHGPENKRPFDGMEL